MESVRLNQRLVQALGEVGVRASRPQLENLALLCQALAFSRDCHLASLALHLPIAGCRASRTQRLRRWLKNAHLDVPACYAPVRQELLRNGTGQEVCLVLDRTDIACDLSILLLGLAYHKRVLPLVWQVLRFGGTGVAQHLPLLQQVQPDLPAGHPVWLLADSEFRSLAVQAWCRTHAWHWQVGVSRELVIRDASGAPHALHQLGLQLGERRYLQGVYLSHDHPFGPVNLIADWAPRQSAPRYWTLDLPADARAWRYGRKRFWIEPTFRDWKGAGFDLEASLLRDPQRLDHLLLALALTQLWLLHIGEWLRRSGRATEFSPQPADYSLFRLGRDYLQRSQCCPAYIPVDFHIDGYA